MSDDGTGQTTSSFWRRLWRRIRGGVAVFWNGPGGDLVRESWDMLLGQVEAAVIQLLLEQASVHAADLETQHPSGTGKGALKWESLQAFIAQAAISAGIQLATRAVQLIAAHAVASPQVQALKGTPLAERVDVGEGSR